MAGGRHPAPEDAARLLVAFDTTDGQTRKISRYTPAARTELAMLPTLFLAEFETETGRTPGRVEHVAGAFRFSDYDFFRAWAMRRNVDQKGEMVEPDRDKEYTDWSALILALDGREAGVAPRVKAGAASAGRSGSRAFRRPRSGSRGN